MTKTIFTEKTLDIAIKKMQIKVTITLHIHIQNKLSFKQGKC